MYNFFSALSQFSSMHYIGYLEDGTMIDNSYTRGQPLYFVLGTVITFQLYIDIPILNIWIASSHAEMF